MMAVQTLPRLQEVLGEEGVDELVHWLDDRIAEQAVPRDEYREVLSRLDILEHSVSDIKVDLRSLRQEINERFDRVNERFDRVNERFDQMNARFDQMYDRMLVQTRWLIGSLALIGAVVSTLLAIGQFVK
jgi:tetrahydromethanopterin S-methyltransferase subunit G